MLELQQLALQPVMNLLLVGKQAMWLETCWLMQLEDEVAEEALLMCPEQAGEPLLRECWKRTLVTYLQLAALVLRPANPHPHLRTHLYLTAPQVRNSAGLLALPLCFSLGLSRCCALAQQGAMMQDQPQL